MKIFTRSLMLLLSFILIIGISVPGFAMDYDVIENDGQDVQVNHS